MTYISETKVFAHLDRLHAWRRGGTPAPVTVEWDLSNRCSLGCQSCHFAHTHTRGPWTTRDRRLPMAFDGTGDLADVSVVRRGLGEMAAAGVQGVVWSGGGEPTLHPDWLDVLQMARKAGLLQGLYTLGGHFDSGSAHAAAKLLSFVVVSLDAADAATYAAEKGVPLERFHKACHGVRWLTQANTCTVGVSFLLHAGNWSRAEEMLALGRELGASYVTFRPAIETSPDDPARAIGDRQWIAEGLALLSRLAAESDVECDVDRFVAYAAWTGRAYDTCHGIKLNATITPDGRVWVCPQRRGVAGSEIGDLRRESFGELWSRHPRQWTDFSACRVMCRLHLVNEQLAPVFATRVHEAFV